ncbi:xylulokinase [Paenibacillus sp. 32O-W]|uniref:xylulokinase n=1 Tax=Paenibacillus sp. 32O-W TaxID=1695218 RepID=UPI0011A14EA5|nr:xylulokinase [Paenibacillus sp. 32O-W]
MKYVIGIDLGTSSVKTVLVSREGEVCHEASREYPLIQLQSGYSEQDPEEWVRQTKLCLKDLLLRAAVPPEAIEGISFSGQMHGLVLLDEEHRPVRHAILWNDTRTTAQCREIEAKLGDRLLAIAKNPALEGFTLPKLLWVRDREPECFRRAVTFVLPKDYLRYRLTGQLHMDYSDAAGTLLLDVGAKRWSETICDSLGLPLSLCPLLVESHDCVGHLLPEVALETGLLTDTRVFAGGADNACGAVGAGILSPGETLCSIGTSGVILSCETNRDADYQGRLHFFNHAKPDAYYVMGVTLAAGYSLSWFKNIFAANESFGALMKLAESVPPGANGLLFTPYVVGERTPHADSLIRGSFIGMDSAHTKADFVRAVMEGITFSLHESVKLMRDGGKTIDTVVSIGGGAKSEIWLQMQADIFDAAVVKLGSEQGPAMGAAMLAAYGCGWFATLEECAARFITRSNRYEPRPEAREKYARLFDIYQEVYGATKSLNARLLPFRRGR